MKVQLLVSRSGPNGAFNRGDEIEVSEREAKRMFEANPPQAQPVRDAPEPETATASPKSTTRRGRKPAEKADG